MRALAPRLAAPMAMAAPRPVPPPVTKITLPSNSPMRPLPFKVADPRGLTPQRYACPTSVPSCVEDRPRGSVSCLRIAQLAPGVGHDPGMIERQVQLRPTLHPFGARGVVARLRSATRKAGQEGHGARVAARIAKGIGVDANELEPTCLDCGLFHQLAPACLLHGLPDVHEAARQGILALVGWVLAPDEQQPPVAIDRDAVHGQCRSSGERHWGQPPRSKVSVAGPTPSGSPCRPYGLEPFAARQPR